MRSENTEWTKAGVWICTKCIKDSDTAEKLKAEWKLKLKDLNLSSEIRVMTTSCLNECPVGEQAILISPKSGKQEVIVCDPKTEAAEVFQKILQIAARG